MAPTISPDTVVVRNPRLAFRTTQDGGVLLHLDTGSYHALNPTGALIWEAMEGTSTPVAIVDSLEDRIDADRDVLLEDVLSFLGDLATRDAIAIQ